MTDLGTRLELEDDAFAVTTNAPTASIHVWVLGARAVDIVFFFLLIVFGIIRTGNSGRGSCGGVTVVERGDVRQQMGW